MVKRFLRLEFDGGKKIRKSACKILLFCQKISELIFHERNVRIELIRFHIHRPRGRRLANLREHMGISDVAGGKFVVFVDESIELVDQPLEFSLESFLVVRSVGAAGAAEDPFAFVNEKPQLAFGQAFLCGKWSGEGDRSQSEKKDPFHPFVSSQKGTDSATKSAKTVPP